MRKGIAADLESFVRHHADLAKLGLRLLMTEGLPEPSRASIVAAAIYSCDQGDLIPDEFPVYGLLDDLFVLAIGIDEALSKAGEVGAPIGVAEVGGETLSALLIRMQSNFTGFWTYCKKNTEGFFANMATQLPNDPTLVDRTRDWFAQELPKLTHRTRSVNDKLADEEVDRFLATYRA